MLEVFSAQAGTSKASQAFWEVRDIHAVNRAPKARGVMFERDDLDDDAGPWNSSVFTGGGANARVPATATTTRRADRTV